MKALIIDDSRATRRIIGEFMKTLGFETLEAGNGLEGLAQLKQHGNPDVVLVDWNMPEMNGLDFVKAVRAAPEYADLPMMMVTTETEMERMALAFMAGVNEYVMKPFCAETIREKLELIGVGVNI
ncbi:MAG TPA: response regulator [Planctomycetaceae bacterium]|nr:response regulator [Planctomycetaceae bacterium]